ncbi:DsbA family protein [Rhizobium grahamii]|nr:thioredoxin domain-containing protein [Rhizobium grahamii]
MANYSRLAAGFMFCIMMPTILSAQEVGSYLSSKQSKEMLAERPAIIASESNNATDSATPGQEASETDAILANRVNVDTPSSLVRLGTPDAEITIVEYTDLQCPYCGTAHTTLKTLLEKYDGTIQIQIKQFPLDFHPLAGPGARYLIAIALQDPDKAAQFYELVMTNQRLLNDYGKTFYDGLATALDVDATSLKATLESPDVLKIIEKDKAEAEAIKVSGTPTFVINGVKVAGAQPLETFTEIIDKLLEADATGVE